VSCASLHKSNAVIERSMRNSYTARRPKNAPNGNLSARGSIEPPTNAEGKDANELLVAANVMRLSGYQADPLAATMNTRSLGLTKLN